MLYEKLSDHANDGINILFADGHVEFLQRPPPGRCSDGLV